jgi:hypothetical protein
LSCKNGYYERVRAESRRAKFKHAERHSADFHHAKCIHAELSRDRSYKMSNIKQRAEQKMDQTDKLSNLSYTVKWPNPIGLLFLVTIIPLGAYLS